MMETSHPEDVKRRVDEILAASDDPEASHGLEDELFLDLIGLWCPAFVTKELERLNGLTRWYA